MISQTLKPVTGVNGNENNVDYLITMVCVTGGQAHILGRFRFQHLGGNLATAYGPMSITLSSIVATAVLLLLISKSSTHKHLWIITSLTLC